MLASGPHWTVVSTRHLPRAAPPGLNGTEEAGGRQHSLLSLGSDRAEGPDEPEVLVRGQLQGEGWGSAPGPQAPSSLATARLALPGCRPPTSWAPTLVSSSRKISMKWLFTPLGASLSGCRISVVSSSSSCSVCLGKTRQVRQQHQGRLTPATPGCCPRTRRDPGCDTHTYRMSPSVCYTHENGKGQEKQIN